MNLNFVFYSDNKTLEKKWAENFEAILKLNQKNNGINIQTFSSLKNIDQHEKNTIFLVDVKKIGLYDFIQSVDKNYCKIVILLAEDDEKDNISLIRNPAKVDYFLVYPFRVAEVLNTIHFFEQFKNLDELSDLNKDFSELITFLKEDLELAEKLQKRKVPERFKELKALNIQSRYYAGMRSGGDFFDVAESQTGSFISMVMTHSSTYGLSSALLAILMRVALKLTVEQGEKAGKVREVVKNIFDEISLILKQKDELSLLYAIWLKDQKILRMINWGSTAVFYSSHFKDEFKLLSSQGPLFSKNTHSQKNWENSQEMDIALDSESRVILLSGGSLECLGGVNEVLQLIQKLRRLEPKDLLNELSHQIHLNVSKKEDYEKGVMPVDCSLLVVEPSLTLARLKQ